MVRVYCDCRQDSDSPQSPLKSFLTNKSKEKFKVSIEPAQESEIEFINIEQKNERLVYMKI